MVTLTLLMLIMGSLITSYVFIMKSTYGLGNYVDMNTQTRIGLEKFGRDIRMATDIFTISSTKIDFDIPNSAGGSTAIRYEYDPTDKTLLRVQAGTGGGKKVILRDVQRFALKYFTHTGGTTANLLAVKKVQIDLTMRRNVLALENTNHVTSAQFMMRNR